MSAIDRVKELLAAAEKDTSTPEEYEASQLAFNQLEDWLIPIAEELVASQEALEVAKPVLDWRRNHSHPFLSGPHVEDAAVIDAALRMDGLAEAMGVVE